MGRERKREEEYVRKKGMGHSSHSFFLSDSTMRAINFIGKALLIVILPVAFCAVSSIIITALMASIGALMGHNTFQSCFQHALEFVSVVMMFVTFIGTLYYFATEGEES